MTTFTWHRNEEADVELYFEDSHGTTQTISIFDKLSVEGFDDDGICEIFYDFTDWSPRDVLLNEPLEKEFNKENCIKAIDEWGLIEELGLIEYKTDSNLYDVLYEILKDEWEARQ